MEFSLEEKEYVQLNQLLKIMRLVGSGGEAKIRILEGEVFVNGEVENQIRKKLKKGDEISVMDHQIKIVD